MPNKPKVTVVGSYAVGLTMRSSRLPVKGETLTARDYAAFHGGKGSNQAVGAARQGADVSFISAVGDDDMGKRALNLYAAENVDTQFIKISNMPTGVGFIIVDDDGNNIITVDLGANNDIDDALLEESSEIMRTADVVLMQMEIPIRAVAKTADLTYCMGVRTILNPAPFNPLPENTYGKLWLVTPNEIEARLMLGLSPDADIDVRELAKALISKGITNVIITLGEKGALISCKDKTEITPAFKTDVLDTTGAGDAFTSSLGVAIASGATIKEATVYAAASAALSVSKYGVIESLPTKSETEAFLRL